MSGDVHVRFCERLEGRFLRATRPVVGFQHRDDGERFLADLKERLEAFALSLHAEKTRLIEFGKSRR